MKKFKLKNRINVLARSGPLISPWISPLISPWISKEKQLQILSGVGLTTLCVLFGVIGVSRSRPHPEAAAERVAQRDPKHGRGSQDLAKAQSPSRSLAEATTQKSWNQRLADQLRDHLPRGADPSSAVQADREGVVITLPGDLVFSVGSAQIDGRSESNLKALAKWLSTQDRVPNVKIESHTDDTPVVKHRRLFHSNWELSAARAARLASLFEQSKYPISHLQASVYSSSRPIAESRELNRRIVIRLSQENPGG